MTDQPGPATPRSAISNIETVVRMEQEAQEGRRFSERLSDAIAAFVGSIPFVVVHVIWFAIWAAINLRLIPGMPAFDPYPFALMCMLVSLEGVLLSTFVLIKQNRMSQRSDRRSQLDLQVNLLSEQEVTKVLQMLERISEHLRIAPEVVDAEAEDLAQVTAVEELSRELERKLPDEG